MRWAVLLIFGTIGLDGLVAGTIWGREAWPVIRDNAQTRGTVVDHLAEKSGPKSGVVYFPVVEFSTGGRVKTRFRDHVGSAGEPAYDTGATVDILYDPRNPEKGRIGSYQQLWSGPLAVGSIGLTLLLLSILLFVKIGRFEHDLKAVGSGKRGDGSGGL